MMIEDFCVVILSHGRADKMATLKTLERGRYSGPTYILIDDEDPQEGMYRNLYGDKVVSFSKQNMDGTFDIMDNFTQREGRQNVTYARNAVFEIVRNLGYKWFLVLDDDYTRFRYVFDGDFNYQHRPVVDLDSVFRSILEFYQSIPALSVAMAQDGDFIGGSECDNASPRLLRKAMNTFFCCTDRPFKFSGRINEDVNAYVSYGMRGELFFTTTMVSVKQNTTQATNEGLTPIYKRLGTYVKSFYTVMMAPSAVKVRMLQTQHPRLHHEVTWNNVCPKIISERHRKRSGVRFPRGRVKGGSTPTL